MTSVLVSKKTSKKKKYINSLLPGRNFIIFFLFIDLWSAFWLSKWCLSDVVYFTPWHHMRNSRGLYKWILYDMPMTTLILYMISDIDFNYITRLACHPNLKCRGVLTGVFVGSPNKCYTYCFHQFNITIEIIISIIWISFRSSALPIK